MWEVRQYTDNDLSVWNHFVDSGRQNSFLFNRGYMDYHRDRFHDCSLMIYHRDRLFALLPANSVDHVLWSHQGLTYGGLITHDKATVATVCDCFTAVNDYLRSHHFSKVIYKALPWIYQERPSEEDLYALINVCNARLTARHASSTLTSRRLRFEESRKSGVRKAMTYGITIYESDDLAAFWTILEDNLMHTYGVRPVHTLEEMRRLKNTFPDQIKLFLACKDGRALGGTLIYETSRVIHTQYISASVEGKAVGALDALFDYLLHERYTNVPFFDFGKSSNGDGHELNRNLIFQKEGFGGRTVCYDWYMYDL